MSEENITKYALVDYDCDRRSVGWIDKQKLNILQKIIQCDRFYYYFYYQLIRAITVQQRKIHRCVTVGNFGTESDRCCIIPEKNWYVAI